MHSGWLYPAICGTLNSFCPTYIVHPLTMKRPLPIFVLTFAILTLTAVALAQDLTCPDVTVAALQSSDINCVICPGAATLTPSLDNSTPNILVDSSGNSVDLAT